MIYQAEVVAQIVANGAPHITRIKIKGLPKNIASLRFFDIPGNTLKLGQRVEIEVRIPEVTTDAVADATGVPA